jgi:uncharacterized membrane protein
MSGASFPKNRLEALSDGLFAIVMTLLVLELRVPELPRKVASAVLVQHLRELLPTFFSFFVTFILAAAFWFLHQRVMDVTSRLTRALIWINLLFLMFVALLPFSTALLGRYSLSNHVSLGFYFGNQLAISAVLLLHWIWAKQQGLIQQGMESERVSSGIWAIPVGSALALVASGIQPSFSFTAFTLGIILTRALSAGKKRRRARRQS